MLWGHLRSSILAWRIPWTEEPGGLQSTGSQRGRHDWATSITMSCVRFAECIPLLTKWKLYRCRVRWWLPGSGVHRRIGWCWSNVTNCVLFDWGRDWTHVCYISALAGPLGGPLSMHTGTGFWFFYSFIPLFLSLPIFVHWWFSVVVCSDFILFIFCESNTGFCFVLTMWSLHKTSYTFKKYILC